MQSTSMQSQLPVGKFGAIFSKGSRTVSPAIPDVPLTLDSDMSDYTVNCWTKPHTFA